MFALYLCLLFAYYLTTMNVSFVFFIFDMILYEYSHDTV